MTRAVRPDPKKNTRVAVMAAGLVASMIGLSYASVPLYRLFCQVTGFGGTTQVAEAAPEKASTELITIRFDANIDRTLGWNFHPKQNTMTVKIGESSMAYYVSSNPGSAPSTGSAVFNVTPVEAGIYFNKIECFCFTEQTLKAGESVEMPVQFFVDPAILDDPDARSISEITLSYTFYPVKTKAPEKQATVKTN
jgi:cytochrome c oxidase assembly protein subunit 11